MSQSKIILSLKNRKVLIEKKLGEGKRGAVFLATDANGTQICVKKEKSLERAQREVNAIDAFYGIKQDVTEHDGGYYFTMPYFPGKNLKQALNDGLTLYEKLVIAEQLKQQLELLHQKGFLHRDIKPDNIMVHIQGDKIEVNLIDLGRSTSLDGHENLPLTTPKIYLALQRQVAPEFLRPESPIGPHSDVYSYGKVLNFLFPDSQERLQSLVGFDVSKRMASYAEINSCLTEIFETQKKALIEQCTKYIITQYESKKAEALTQIDLVKQVRDDLLNAQFNDKDSLEKVGRSLHNWVQNTNKEQVNGWSLSKGIHKFLTLFNKSSLTKDQMKLVQSAQELGVYSHNPEALMSKYKEPLRSKDPEKSLTDEKQSQSENDFGF